MDKVIVKDLELFCYHGVNPEEKIEYFLKSESGPDHDKNFTVQVLLNHNVIGEGVGHSKKSAEQSAAKEALALMGITVE